MRNKRLRFLWGWIDFPVEPDEWKPKRDSMGEMGYEKLPRAEKRVADNFSIFEQRMNYLEDAIIAQQRAIVLMARVGLVVLILLAATIGPQMLSAGLQWIGVRNIPTAVSK